MQLGDFNIINLSKLDENEILKRINELFIQEVQGDLADTPVGIMKNAEILSSILPYYIELASRTEKDYKTLKLDNDSKEYEKVVSLRNKYEQDYPDKKIPAMSYFESDARNQMKEERKKEIEKELRARRFKDIKTACIEQIQVLKKKQDGLKIV
ncbi:MAG: hypothetical protein KBT03_04080 [Bacteroidales bacterium]|nr:hypothetical protein [Candidatus Scybalousia scybalohippi]